MENSLQPIRILARESWAFYRANFKTIASVILPVAVLLVASDLTDALHGPRFLAGIFELLGGLLGVIAFLSQIQLIGRLEKNDSVTEGPKEIYKKVLPFFFPYILVNILLFFISFGSAIPFVIPVIIAAIFLSFTQYALLLDGHKGMKALVTSVHYVKDRWLGVAGRLILFNVLCGIPLMIIAVVSAIIDPTAYAGSTTTPPPLTSAITSIVSLFFAVPLITIIQTKIYNQLKVLKGGVSDEEFASTKKILWGVLIWGVVTGVTAAIFVGILIAKNLPLQ